MGDKMDKSSGSAPVPQPAATSGIDQNLHIEPPKNGAHLTQPAFPKGHHSQW